MMITMSFGYYLRIIVILNCLVIPGLCECPDGFLHHGNFCYHFSHDKESWVDAKEICKELFNGMLVEVFDAKENNFLLNQSKQQHDDFWIGATDLQVEGEWKWATSHDDVTFTSWGTGQPSGGSENCMELNAGGTWNDQTCSDRQKYVCEISHEGGSEIIG